MSTNIIIIIYLITTRYYRKGTSIFAIHLYCFFGGMCPFCGWHLNNFNVGTGEVMVTLHVFKHVGNEFACGFSSSIWRFLGYALFRLTCNCKSRMMFLLYNRSNIILSQVSVGYFLADIGMIFWLYPSLGGIEYVSVWSTNTIKLSIFPFLQSTVDSIQWIFILLFLYSNPLHWSYLLCPLVIIFLFGWFTFIPINRICC